MALAALAYKLPPNVTIAWCDALMGACGAALLFVAWCCRSRAADEYREENDKGESAPVCEKGVNVM